MKKTNHISEAMSEIKSDKKIKNKLNTVKIESVLIEVFGPSILSYIHRMRVKDDILYLQLNSSTLKHKLHADKEALVERINEHLAPHALADMVLTG